MYESYRTRNCQKLFLYTVDVKNKLGTGGERDRERERERDRELLHVFMITVDNLSHFVVAVTNVTPTVTAPSELSPSDYVVCATRVDPIPASTTMTFRCESTDVIGRYVFVLRTDTSDVQLVMCEVEVYSGMIGVSCCLQSEIASRFCILIRVKATLRVRAIVVKAASLCDCLISKSIGKSLPKPSQWLPRMHFLLGD